MNFVKTHRRNKTWRVTHILVEGWLMEPHLNTLIRLHNVSYSFPNEVLVRESAMMAVDRLPRIETLYKVVTPVVYLTEQHVVAL